MNNAVIRISTEKVPALEESANVAEAGQLDAADRVCRRRGSNVAHAQRRARRETICSYWGTRRINTNVIKPEGGTIAGA
jgi:hypothetical protein